MADVVLGLNGANGIGHDAGAALIVEDRLVVAVEEERLIRAKRAYGLPPLRSMLEVLDAAGVAPGDIDIVAHPWLPAAMGVAERDVEHQVRSWFRRVGLTLEPGVELRFVEHHTAHAWAGLAFAAGGVGNRRAAVLVLDGSGESTSGAGFVFDGSLDKRWNLRQASSLGTYYEAMTQFLGFRWGEEGKAMGLASYGRHRDLPIPPLPDERFTGPLPPFHDEGLTPRDVHAAVRQNAMDELRRLHGDDLSFNARADIALATQQVVVRRILDYVAELVDGAELLVLSGGVALNCAANAEVAALSRSLGVELVIAPPASDTGIAIGAAVAVSDNPARIEGVDDPFLGRLYTPGSIVRDLRNHGFDVVSCDAASLAAKLWGESLVCGWFEGRSEVGPRALGKRSIIARPDSVKVRDRLNYLKGRESWRPLAPSVTASEFERSFRESTPSPHMLIAASAAPGASARLAGVIHVDNSSRPQVVNAAGPYRDLLAAMEKAGGSAAMVCTSFNQAGEPIVYSPADAVASALAMGLDLLAGDGWCCDLRRS